MPNIEITHPAPDGNGTSIVIDGVEMNHSISSGARLELGGDRVRMTVDIHAIQNFRLCSADAEVIIDGASQDMLVAAGWTPPSMADKSFDGVTTTASEWKAQR